MGYLGKEPVRLSGKLYDSNNVVGAGNSTLISTGDGVSWKSPSDYFVQSGSGIHTTSYVGIGTTNPTLDLDIYGDVSIASTGTTKSGWFSTLDSKSNFDNVSLFLQPDSVYDFSSSKTAAENYYSSVFTSALTSANTTHLSQVIGGRFNTNVAGTNSTSPVVGYGAIFSTRRNSTTDVSASTSNKLFGNQSFVIQGLNVSDSVNTEDAHGSWSGIYQNKGNITNAHGLTSQLTLAHEEGDAINTDISDTTATGVYHVSIIGNYTGAASTISEYSFFKSSAIILPSARIPDVYGLKLDFLCPFSNKVDRYKAIDIGTTSGPSLQYSIYSPYDRIHMYHDGNIGIGTTLASAQLHIYDREVGVSTDHIRITRSTDVSTFSNPPTGRGSILLDSSLNSTDSTGQILNAISFTGQGTGRRRAMIANVQGGSSGTGGDLAFYTNSTSSSTSDFVSERMRVLGSGGITFGGDTSSSNALNDYEEGTFTPSFVNGGSLTYYSRVGNYIKVGNLVTAWVYIFINSNGTASGNFRIQGFPYTPTTTCMGSTVYGDAWSTARRDLITAIGDTGLNTEAIFYYNSASLTPFSPPQVQHSDVGGSSIVSAAWTYTTA